ncbi:MAG: hypothetical protein HYS23_03510 [Geobacter sp.]|nr:hypothetical protein [Geobacter sp.]
MSKFIITETWIFLIGLAIIVVYQLLTGKINMTCLLYEKNTAVKYSPGRVQLLAVVIGSMFYYLLKVCLDPSHFPTLPLEFLLLSGGGNLIYLIGKSYSLLKNMAR